MITADTLREADLFRGLAPAELDELAPLAREETLRKDQVLFRERDPGDRIYLVLSGVIEIGRTGSAGGRVRLERGGVFGELPLLDEGGRPASATAAVVPETRVASWSAADLNALFGRNPALGCRLLQALGRRLAARLRASAEGLHALLKEPARGSS